MCLVRSAHYHRCDIIPFISNQPHVRHNKSCHKFTAYNKLTIHIISTTADVLTRFISSITIHAIVSQWNRRTSILNLPNVPIWIMCGIGIDLLDVVYILDVSLSIYLVTRLSVNGVFYVCTYLSMPIFGVVTPVSR